MFFKRLKLQGFKSFVESTDLEIGDGLTGIVGPNGCGKSNLVEALRWSMGETSAKRMRGTGMEDVIFAGTTARPPRNLAEVSLVLDNSDRTAPAEFNDADELTVTRRIERGGGSDYRVNGKPARQRDIQLLFADLSTGAHSTSVVGQGQVDALIRAKPQDRRQILEEASGTAGLQARRHEAELKLKAAEQNLTRVDDILRTLDTQLRSLKTQVRQASRYRNLAEHIRRTEAALLHLRWLEAEEDAIKSKEALTAAESRANELLAIVTRGNTDRTEVVAELPALRQAEAAAAAIVQKLTLAREQIDAEANRVAEQIRSAETRAAQAQSDQEREIARSRDGQEAVTRLGGEQETLTTQIAEINSALPAITEALTASSREVQTLDSALNDLMSAAATAEARQKALTREIEALSERRATLTRRRAEMDASRAQLAGEIASRSDLSLASAMVEACETELERRKTQSEEAKQARAVAEETQNEARARAQEADRAVTKLRAEADALTKMLAHQDNQADQVIDVITVTPGLEKALAVALGEALTASLDEQAAMFWRAMPPLANPPALPSGTQPLASAIQAPPALARSLSQIGLVDDKAQGEAALENLQPGQILVSRDGWAWRWDGFTLSPDAKTASAMRLQQRNRLTALQTEIAQAQTVSEQEAQALLEASSLLQQCQSLDQQTRSALDAAFAALNDARANLAREERETSAAHAKLNALDETLGQLNADFQTLRDRAEAIEDERATLPDIDALRAAISDKRVVLAEARATLARAQSDRDRLTHESQTAAARQNAVTRELNDWRQRMQSAQKQSEALGERIAGLQQEIESLRARPAELAASRAGLLSELETAEENRTQAADALIAKEQRLSVIEHQLKLDEAALGDAREARVRAESAVTASEEHFNTLRERMSEKLGCAPEALAQIAELSSDDALPSVFELEQVLGRYVRERDNMGPVNLRAEVEAETTEADITKLTQEKDDLTAAIAKLRQGIGQLNKEARERLNEAFSHVNERFQKLFTKLFGGGKAWLELIDNEDPMNAGLEIYAAPPGKKQQVLSLLSGGERTLTALALLFAVFQTTPSPICVLDEAEAALDESNIGRFCELVTEIGAETGTRFLIITHQRLTMAHMDRLFGVTMREKGVSKLVSVDLAGAVALRDKTAAPSAAAQATETLAAVNAA